MPLLAAKLAAELEKIEPSDDEAVIAQGWADAFFTYIVDMTGAGIPCVPSIITPLKPVMVATMQGMSVPGLAPLKIQNAITAVWGLLAPQTTALFAGTVPPLTPPTGNSGITAAMLAVAPVNVLGQLSKKDSMRALAEAIHSTQILGGLVTKVDTTTGPIL